MFNMSKRFITVQEACALLDEVSDDEEGELVILPPDQKGDITDEEKDDEDITEYQVLEDVAGEVEVFHSSSETSEQEEVTERVAQGQRKGQNQRRSRGKKSQAYYAFAHWYSTTVRRNTATTK